ncbi:hypothetical protein Hanom_Chr01g00050831 [Helianthus anomalus]
MLQEATFFFSFKVKLTVVCLITYAHNGCIAAILLMLVGSWLALLFLIETVVLLI